MSLVIHVTFAIPFFIKHHIAWLLFCVCYILFASYRIIYKLLMIEEEITIYLLDKYIQFGFPLLHSIENYLFFWKLRKRVKNKQGPRLNFHSYKIQVFNSDWINNNMSVLVLHFQIMSSSSQFLLFTLLKVSTTLLKVSTT